MKNLITPTGLRIAGRFIAPGEAVPGDVLGFDYEKAARKGMIEDEDGDDIVNPATTTDPAADAGAPADSQDGIQVEELLRANRDLKESLDTARAERRQDIERLAAEIRSARANLENTQKGYDDDRAEMEGKLAALTGERDAARKALEEVTPLPADALARLEGVTGIGKALAEKALAALTGK